MSQEPFYDPKKSYEENFSQGPFGVFADKQVIERADAPTQELFGRALYTPFGIPAGPLLNGNFVRAAWNKGFDICVYKTVRSRGYPSHPHPNVVAVHVGGDLTLARAGEGLVGDEDYSDEKLGITNSFGVPSPEPEWWQVDLESLVRDQPEGQMVWGSFQGTAGGGNGGYLADWKLTARLVAETGVSAMIANLSCPNEGSSHLLCFDVDMVERVAHAIKEEIGNIPLLLKLTYFEDDATLESLYARVADVVQGLVAINTIPARIIDVKGNQALPGGGRAVSGVCGAPIRWAGIDMIRRLDALRKKRGGKMVLVGVGGVLSSDDYLTYREAGADVVMSATGAMWNPYLAQEIIQLA